MRANSIRALAFEHLSDGATKSDTAKHIRVHRSTVYRWTRQGRDRKKEARVRLNRRKLTLGQEREVLAALRKMPSMSLAQIAEYAISRFHVRISSRGVSNIISRNGFTRKKGTKLNIKYQRDLGSRYLEELRARYTPMIASLDEASFMLNLAPTYGWAPKGQRAVISQPGKRTVSLLLCICPVGVLNWRLRSGTFDSIIFLDFLRQLPNGITLMLDNARIHHATKCLQDKGLPAVEELARSKSIDLMFTPPYAPHLNPVEYTFNTVRQLLRNQQAWTEAKLIRALTIALKSEAFSSASMTKLFRSVLWGGPDPGTRAIGR